MAVSAIVAVPGARFEDTLESASPDLLREMIRGFAQRMMDAEVEQLCGAGYGEVSPDRVNSRNGYRRRDWDTRAGTIEVAVPKLRQCSYYPEWLLEGRRRAERALATVVATSYLLGVSTRRVEKLAESLGVTKLSKSQVSVMAAELDEMVTSFRSRPLDAGPYTFVWIDALTQKVREGGRTGNVHALIATGVNADGKREILGLDVASSEDGAGRPAAAIAGCGTRSPRSCPARPGSGAVRTTPGTWPRRCPSPRSRGCPPWSAPSSSSPARPRFVLSTPRSYPRWRRSSRPPPPTSTRHARTSWRSLRSPGRSGARRGAILPRSASIKRYAGEPTSSGSSLPATPSSALSAPSLPSRTTNGLKPAATWALKSLPPAAR